MFDGLKKKLSGVIKAFSSREEKALERQEGKAEEKAKEQLESEEEGREGTAPESKEAAAPQPRAAAAEPARAPGASERDAGAEARRPAPAPPLPETGEPERPPERRANEKPGPHAAEQMEERSERPAPAPRQHRGQAGIRISAATKIRGAILGRVKLSDSDIEGFLDTLRMSMLESDVGYNDTEEFVERLGTSLRDEKLNARDIRAELMKSVRESLLAVISKTTGVNLESFVASRIGSADLPVKILFIGPNGTGKTTTIAKIAHLLKRRGVSIAISASDTFRAAAIEQTEYHAAALQVPVIKSRYGADPASVAFDAVAYAKAHGLQVVLIDSAGRQETNRNLIGELQKMERVIKPDLSIYVCESTGGNAIISQVKEFMNHIRVDGIILTKLDCDAKGGGAISIANETGVPILFLGTGEKYDDLMPYDPQVILDAMLPAA